MNRGGDVYAQRPWLQRYSGHVPADLAPPFPSALAMFHAQAQARPDEPAIHYFERTLTFAELDSAAAALAAGLMRRGLERGDRVAIYLQNIPQFAIALLATWKLGGIAVPLNPMLKEQEVRYHLTDAGCRALIALESLHEQVGRRAVSGTEVAVVVTTSELDYAGEPIPTALAGSARVKRSDALDLVEIVAQHAGRPVLDPGLGPDDVAALTYTSGTTGRPKGAMNLHRNLVYNSEVYRVWMALAPGDVILGAAPLFHITGLVAGLGAALRTGLPLVLFHRFDAGEALRMIERWHATFTVASITAFLAMLDHPEIGDRDLTSFRKVFSGGAPVAPATVERWERQTGSYIHNIYGLTETNSPSHAVPLGSRAPVDPASGALAVGLPVPGALVKVVDAASGAPLPPGTVGELWISGPQVVPGYWQKPDDTATSFTDGFLHTGDVGFMDPEGWFYIVDRAKDMINAGGYKVWPREVEDFLYQHPAVREAAVIGVPDPYRGETVKAFVALKAGMVASEREIIDFCRERMAAYKRPRFVEVLDEVPKTPTGKFLRRELRDRGQSRPRSSGD